MLSISSKLQRRIVLLILPIIILIFKFPTLIPFMAIAKTKFALQLKLNLNADSSNKVSQVCKIPKLDPFHKSIKHVIKAPQDPKCSKLWSIYFKSTLDFGIIPAMTVDQFHLRKIRSCCYKTISRANSDFGYKFSELCYPISLENRTNIHPSHEFIAIFCSHKNRLDVKAREKQLRFVDLHSFVPIKPEVERRLESVNLSEGDRPNVILFGLDAVSRTNFLRWLPKSHKYLMEDMGAIDMQGYNKVADNTLQNIAVLLTSQSLPHLASTCANRTKQLDECPFIWKNFSRKGYRTAFAEDSVRGIFVFGGYKGFENQPTDYYLRTYNHVSDYYFRQRRRGKKACSGGRLSFNDLLSHMTKFTHKMNELNKQFFYFSWESTLTHDTMNDAALAEKPLLKALQWLQMNEQLKNTILIVFSDHGMRVGEIRNYPQGQMEDRLPLLYFVFPEWFKKKYARAINNLKGNRDRLTTVLDLNYALKDILNLEQIKDDQLERRELELKNRSQYESVKGISLFLPIPPERTCKDTIIDPEFCICTFYGSVDIKTDEVHGAVNYVVEAMNRNISRYEMCEKLELEEIKLAQVDLDLDRKYEKRYLINFQTKPGGAQFETLVTKTNIQKGNLTSWKIIGAVLRTNLYKNQSSCVDQLQMKPYCFCKGRDIPILKDRI